MRGAKRTRQQQALYERGVELRQWKLWRRERMEALFADPGYGAAAKALVAFFKTTKSTDDLVSYIEAGPWRGADANVRHEILSLIDAMIVRRRDRMGLPPFDDSLPFSSKPPNVFLKLREMLAGIPAYGGADRGEARLQDHQQHHSIKETT